MISHRVQEYAGELEVLPLCAIQRYPQPCTAEVNASSCCTAASPPCRWSGPRTGNICHHASVLLYDVRDVIAA